jgi:hypothetical protein
MGVGPVRAVGILGLAAVLIGAGCGGDDSGGGSEPSSSKCGIEGGAECAPDSKRVDRVEPVFSHPTAISNPLFPTGTLTQVIQLGDEDGKPARVEATLLPLTKVIDWDGKKVETVVRQFIAYSERRIVEVALDFFAQADDGSVWYFGEDVFNYEDGVVADQEGTWLAGRDGPAGMIMPARPRPGDVYRPENIPGFVFEEVTVRSVGETIDGPRGPVAGAVRTREHLMENTFEDKAFAPGYGEFLIQAEDELIRVALAVPTDALEGPPPAELQILATEAAAMFDAAQTGDWTAASARMENVSSAWHRYEAEEPPGLLGAQTTEVLNQLSGAVNAGNTAGTRQAAVDLLRAGLDLELRHRPPAEVDLARLGPWARQVLVDAAAGDAGAVAGDVAILETIRDRMTHILDAAGAERLKASLGELRKAADGEDLSAVAGAVPALLATLAGLRAR